MNSEIKNYENYEIIKLANSSMMIAFKHNAANHNGLIFSHRFFFTYCSESSYNCIINGKFAFAQQPSCGWGGENYYQYNDYKNGILLSPDMVTFYYQDNTLDFANYTEIKL